MTPAADPRPTLILDSPEATAQFGARLVAHLRPGDAVCLFGALGAGKSTLARGLVRALTSPGEEVPSPTYTLVQSYEGPSFPLAHFDLYRLKSPDEAFELGLDEALADGAVVIEWPERLEGALPADRLEIALSQASEADAGATQRLARITGFGSWIARVRDLLRPPFAPASA